MWILEAFLDGFTYRTDPSRVAWFADLLALALAAKFIQGIAHGGFSRFTAATFERYRLVVERGELLGAALAASYRPLLLVRVVFPILVLVSPATKTAIAACLLCLGWELLFEWRRNTVFLALLCLLLLTAGDLTGVGLGGLAQTEHALTSANTWTQVLVVILMSHVYLNSAWLKLRSWQFRTGRTLALYVHFHANVRHRLLYRETYLPVMVVRALGGYTEAHIKRWKPLSRLAIAVEGLLPFGLLFPPTYLLAIVVGAAMHAAFTGLLPHRLVPFSLAAGATYIVFQPL